MIERKPGINTNDGKQTEILRKFRQFSTVNQIVEYVAIAQNEAKIGPDKSIYGYYQRLANQFPGRTPGNVQKILLDNIRKADNPLVPEYESWDHFRSKEALVLLNIKTVLTAVDSFAHHQKDDRDDIVQAALTEVYANIEPKHNDSKLIVIEINIAAKKGITKYLRDRDGIPTAWTKRRDVVPATSEDGDTDSSDILSVIDREIAKNYVKYKGVFPSKELYELARKLNIEPNLFSELFIYRMKYRDDDGSERGTFPPPNVPDLEQVETRVDIEAALRFLESKGLKKKVIAFRLYMGLYGDPPMTLDEIGKIYSVTGTRISQWVSGVQSKIKVSNRLKTYE